MKKRLLYIALFISLCQPLFSQKVSNFQFDAGLVWNHQGFLKLFDGTLDLGAGYNLKLLKDLYGGLAFRIAFLNRSNTTSRALIYRPQLNLHYYFHLSRNVAIIPVVSLGYSFLDLSNKEFDYKELQSGLNTAAELRVLWKRERKLDFFLFGRFEYIYLDQDESFTMVEYYRNIYLTSIGMGIRIKSGENEQE